MINTQTEVRTQYICDRCGHVSEFKDLLPSFKPTGWAILSGEGCATADRRFRFRMPDFKTRIQCKGDVLLCPTCTKGFKEWLISPHFEG